MSTSSALTDIQSVELAVFLVGVHHSQIPQFACLTGSSASSNVWLLHDPYLIFTIAENESTIPFRCYIRDTFGMSNEMSRGSSVSARVSQRPPVPHLDMLVVGTRDKDIRRCGCRNRSTTISQADRARTVGKANCIHVVVVRADVENRLSRLKIVYVYVSRLGTRYNFSTVCRKANRPDLQAK